MSPAIRERMARAARAFAVDNVVDEPFSAILDSVAYRQRVKKKRKLKKQKRAAKWADDDEEEAAEVEGVESYLVDHREHSEWAAGA